MTVPPDEAAAALVHSWQFLSEGLAGGWARSQSGATAGVTGVASPTLNGVLVESADADTEVVAQLLDEVGATGLPYCLQCRPAMEAALDEVASARGMIREGQDVPLMVRDAPGPVALPEPPAHLTIRELAPEEAHIHAEVAAAGFEAPVEHFLQLMTPTMLALPGVYTYLGEVDGVPVTTGLGVRVGTSIAVFNIGTPAEHRRRGYAGAVTSRIVEDGLAAGATWAWLQSSEVGYRVYENLGFRTSESWPCWVTAEQPAS
jgi:hypothetical protein